MKQLCSHANVIIDFENVENCSIISVNCTINLDEWEHVWSGQLVLCIMHKMEINKILNESFSGPDMPDVMNTLMNTFVKTLSVCIPRCINACTLA